MKDNLMNNEEPKNDTENAAESVLPATDCCAKSISLDCKKYMESAERVENKWDMFGLANDFYGEFGFQSMVDMFKSLGYSVTVTNEDYNS